MGLWPLYMSTVWSGFYLVWLCTQVRLHPLTTLHPSPRCIASPRGILLPPRTPGYTPLARGTPLPCCTPVITPPPRDHATPCHRPQWWWTRDSNAYIAVHSLLTLIAGGIFLTYLRTSVHIKVTHPASSPRLRANPLPGSPNSLTT